MVIFRVVGVYRSHLSGSACFEPLRQGGRVMTTKYMHTINGKPAALSNGSIVYNFSTRNTTWAKLCDSLAEIRKQQRISKKTWKEHAYRYMGEDEFKYGYVRILL